MNIVQALDHPQFFGRWFAGPSWDTWRAILKAAYGIPMEPAELELFRSVADRDPPTRRVRELYAVAGRRAGKDSVASLIAAYAAAFADYSGRLRPGEKASVLCLAVNREQAAIVQRYIAAYFRDCPLLEPLVVRNSGDVLELNNNVEIIVATNSFRSIRGKTIAVAILDEAAFWFDENFANPAAEVYSAILPGLITIPDAMLVCISTPWRASGFLYDKWHEHFGKPDDDILVVRGASTQFNPSLPQHFIDAAMRRDPVKARSEWLAEWREDVGSWLPRDLILAAVDAGVAVRPPHPRWQYMAFADVSGGVHDSFTAAVVHQEGTTAILDCLYEQRAPFNPQQVVEAVAQLLRSYRIAHITGDAFAAEWVTAAFSGHGITYDHSELNRSEIYLNVAPLIASGRVRLLDNERLSNQLLALERKAAPGGRDKVDHPPNGFDDLANAAAGAIVLAGVKPDMLDMWRKLAQPAPQAAPSPPQPLPDGWRWVNSASALHFADLDGGQWQVPAGRSTIDPRGAEAIARSQWSYLLEQ